MARHVITIADVSRVHAAVSCLGTADLRDAALVAAPHAALPGATREDVARVAASLIVRATDGDPAAFGLLALSEEQLARADAVVPHPALRSDAVNPYELAMVIGQRDALHVRLTAAEVEAERQARRADAASGELADERDAHLRVRGERDVARRALHDETKRADEFAEQLDEARASGRDAVAGAGRQRERADTAEGALAAERRDHAVTKQERDELAAKLTACEASLGEVSEQLAAAQAAPKKR